MKKQQQIQKLLNIDQLGYDQIYFNAYVRWCESVSINDTQLQMVLANSSVNKYYNMEYAKCEDEFLLLANRYPTATQDDATKLYFRCTVAMFNRRCEPIIKLAKKTPIYEYN